MARLEALQEKKARRMARSNFHDFVRYTKPNYETTFFNRIIADALTRFEEKVRLKLSPRLLIRCPPRAGKSELGSRKFPAWFMGRNPDMDYINTSYAADLAKALGGEARNLVETRKYQMLFPHVKLRRDSKAKDQWNTGQGGSFTAKGVGGGITGKGGNVLEIDDPYKDAKEAWSQAHREKVWDWYKTTAYTRLAPGAGILIIMTSWHEAGLDHQVLEHAKESGDDPWEVIDIPAIMEEGYARHKDDLRKPGESYWPERWPIARLMATKRLLGEYIFNALYQQRAANEKGNIVLREWIRYWSKIPEQFDDMVLSCDLSFKGKKESSRVAMHVWGLKRFKEMVEKKIEWRAKYFLVDRSTKTMEFVESLHEFDRLAKKWPKAKQLVEDKANGPALQSVMQKKYPNIQMVPVDTDKEGRFRAVAPIFERGDVYLPDPQVYKWALDLADEFIKFPNVEHNDDTDATSQGLGHWEVPADGLPRFVEWKL